MKRATVARNQARVPSGASGTTAGSGTSCGSSSTARASAYAVTQVDGAWIVMGPTLCAEYFGVRRTVAGA
ncbi:hypothetical protein ACFQZ4_48890 [Catellatospora coxensis]